MTRCSGGACGPSASRSIAVSAACARAAPGEAITIHANTIALLSFIEPPIGRHAPRTRRAPCDLRCADVLHALPRATSPDVPPAVHDRASAAVAARDEPLMQVSRAT